MQLKPQLPSVEDELCKLLSRWKQTGMKWPYGMPMDINHAAKWWIHVQEMPRNEKPELIQKRQKSDVDPVEYYWKTPYIDRLIYTLNKYLNLPEQHQEIVVKAIEVDIHWRGEDMKFFQTMLKSMGRLLNETGNNQKQKYV